MARIVACTTRVPPPNHFRTATIPFVRPSLELSRIFYTAISFHRGELLRIENYYHVPGGFAVGAEPVRRPGEAPREGVSSKNGWGWGGVMREIGALVQGDGWYKEVCVASQIQTAKWV